MPHSPLAKAYRNSLRMPPVFRSRVQQIKIRNLTPSDPPAYAENPMQEAFYVVLLDRKNHPLGRHLVTLGTLTSSLVHSRETFRAAIIGGAASIVVSHNHPSGDPRPSSADISVTRSLREASQVLGIDLVDHVIVGDKTADPAGKGYYSFREAGMC